ncbi:hypothetical protein PHMEG_00013983 [Phytophthora megakarya]|uniref:Reverse transcriptase domain-containing protein n=1 Tax=Phytophthora megakarya TaxID=4795 RepID=A0A225W6K8_9STRA|nr:hypothetical protein PHMEG_00013983 [Phytophthora megakarya]
MSESLGEDEQQKVVEILQCHEEIMIASCNALPPPAYSVVCDIDVQGHMPIKQRARRTPLRVLEKLDELLKGLLRGGLITFSDSPWTSPIVIVLKTNGVDIRLCIDYKRVNAVTTIMEYAIPLVDGLLTDMEAYLRFCSLDEASGFWAVMTTERARKVPAFVCALGHFEWRWMPFGLKNAPMVYQQMTDNALWVFAQPKCGWKEYSERMRLAEEDVDHVDVLEQFAATVVVPKGTNQVGNLGPQADERVPQGAKMARDGEVVASPGVREVVRRKVAQTITDQEDTKGVS